MHESDSMPTERRVSAEKAQPTLYVVEHQKFASGDISGSLVTVDGEVLHTHMSSSPQWLRNDLTSNFGRDIDLRLRFGDFAVIYVPLSESLPDEIAHHFNSPDDEVVTPPGITGEQ